MSVGTYAWLAFARLFMYLNFAADDFVVVTATAADGDVLHVVNRSSSPTTPS
jgi:hypothetical protein